MSVFTHWNIHNEQEAACHSGQTDPENSEEYSASLFQAMIAATGHTCEVILNVQEYQTVYDVIREAHKARVVFGVCTPTMEMWHKKPIEEIDETIGAAYFIEEAINDNTITY